MKIIITGFVFFACSFSMAGLGLAYNDTYSRDQGVKQADRMRQGNDENIKRTQGDESGRMSIHAQGSLQG